MFTKLDRINNQLVLTNSIILRHNDVISHITVFGTCEYYNLISLHPMFTKIDLFDSQPVLTNLIE